MLESSCNYIVIFFPILYCTYQSFLFNVHQEEQNAGSSANYDVGILHSKKAHDEILCLVRMNGSSELSNSSNASLASSTSSSAAAAGAEKVHNVVLKWCQPRLSISGKTRQITLHPLTDSYEKFFEIATWVVVFCLYAVLVSSIRLICEVVQKRDNFWLFLVFLSEFKTNTNNTLCHAWNFSLFGGGGGGVEVEVE